MLKTRKFWKNNFIQWVLLFLLFLVLAIWLTEIPINDIDKVLPSGGDSYLVTYIWSWEMDQIVTDPLNLFNTNIFAPYENTLAFTEHMLGSLLLAWPLFLIFKNIILVFNIVSLLAFPIAGLGMYLLAYYFTKNRLTSLVAAVIYAFAPLKIHHLEHINLSGMWLPYCFLYLEKFFKYQNWKNVLWLTLFMVLVFLNAMQYFLFLLIAVSLFWLKGILVDKFKLNKNNLFKILVLVFILAIIGILLMMPYLAVKNDYDFQRKITVIEGLCPDLFDYFVSPFFYKYFYSSFFPEWAIGPGIFVILLLIVVGWLIYKRFIVIKIDLIYYYLIGVIAVSFSFGYYIQFTRADKSGLIGPWAFFYHFVPGFDGIRAPGRLSVFFLLSAGVIIAWGLSEIFKRKIISSKKRIILTGLIILLLLIEFNWARPRSYIFLKAEIPAVYVWMRDEGGDAIYLEIPAGKNYENDNYDALYEYYSIYHFKKIVNGFSGYSPAGYKEVVDQLQHFDIEDIDLVKNYGATRIIFHFDYYPANFKETVIDQFNSSNKAELIKIIDNDYIYQIL